VFFGATKVRAHGGTNSAKQSLQSPANRAAFISGWVVNGEYLMVSKIHSELKNICDFI
jgi:hypothetical protein